MAVKGKVENYLNLFSSNFESTLRHSREKYVMSHEYVGLLSGVHYVLRSL